SIARAEEPERRFPTGGAAGKRQPLRGVSPSSTGGLYRQRLEASVLAGLHPPQHVRGRVNSSSAARASRPVPRPPSPADKRPAALVSCPRRGGTAAFPSIRGGPPPPFRSARHSGPPAAPDSRVRTPSTPVVAGANHRWRRVVTSSAR